MEEIARIFDTNVFAAIRTTKIVIPHMAARKRGTVVNVGSVAGIMCVLGLMFLPPFPFLSRDSGRPSPWGGIYAASKAALHSLTDSLYMECKPLNINVVLLAPGAVKSNIATNQAPHINVPADSLYKGYYDHILERLARVQENNPMPTEVYAQKTVNAVLQTRPPRYMSLGKMTGWAKVFSWLPRGWVLNMIWNTLGEGPTRRRVAQRTK